MTSNVTKLIKDRVSIQQIVDRYGYEPNRAGFINCPFHNEKTPSLRVYKESNSFYCFGCNTGGDIIGFVMHLFHIDFGEALVRLDNDFNLNLTNKMSSRERMAAKSQLEEIRNRQAYNKYLMNAYLLHYNAITAIFRAMWSSYINDRPKSQSESLNVQFIHALQNLDYYEYWLETYKTFEKWKEVYG